MSFVFVARSPIARLVEAKKARGWTRHRVYSDASGDYTRDYVSKDDSDVPGYNVFTRQSGVIRHFWAGEMGAGTVDPGQDPRGAPDMDPLWTLLDTTPEGRGADWYPKLSYREMDFARSPRDYGAIGKEILPRIYLGMRRRSRVPECLIMGQKSRFRGPMRS